MSLDNLCIEDGGEDKFSISLSLGSKPKSGAELLSGSPMVQPAYDAHLEELRKRGWVSGGDETTILVPFETYKGFMYNKAANSYTFRLTSELAE